MRVPIIVAIAALLVALMANHLTFAQGLLDDPAFDLPEFPVENEPLDTPTVSPRPAQVMPASTSSEPSNTAAPASTKTAVSDPVTGPATSIGFILSVCLSVGVIVVAKLFSRRSRYAR